MKILGIFRHLSTVAMLALVIVSCSNKKDNSPFNNQLNGNGVFNNGNFNNGNFNNNEVITSLETLQQRIDQRFDIDLQMLQSGSTIACKYRCQEGSPITGCIRVFGHENSQITYKTYRANFEFWNNQFDIQDIIGAEINDATSTGFITKDRLRVELFSLPQNNIQISPVPYNFQGIGQINIYPINTPKGRIGVSPGMPVGANLIPDKQWCHVR